MLALAENAWAQNGAELTQESCLDDKDFHMHGVTMNELMKVPMLLYEYTGKNYKLLYCIALGYPDESPEAKPRRQDMIKFMD